MRHLGQLLLMMLVGACSSLGELSNLISGAEPARQPASDVLASPPVIPQVPGVRRQGDPFASAGADDDGSLWKADLQENYLFTRNLQFKVGDFVYVSFEADLQEFMNLRLAKTLQSEREAAGPGVQKVVAEEAGKVAGDQTSRAVASAVKNDRVAEAVGAAVNSQVQARIAPGKKLWELQEMPMRVIAVLPQGELKIEGSLRRLVENVPVELKLNGRLREQDVGPSFRVSSNRLMDSQMEFVK